MFGTEVSIESEDSKAGNPIFQQRMLRNLLPPWHAEDKSQRCADRRLAEGTRKAVDAWGLKLLCKDPRWKSDSLTVIEVPEVGSFGSLSHSDSHASSL